MSLCWLYFTYQEVRQFIINAREVPDREKGCCQRFGFTLKSHYKRSWNYIDTYMLL